MVCFQFDRKLPGFAARDAVLTGPETRTSSPIRMMRTETCESINLRGLYPCGGRLCRGIMSAAVDGMRVAEQIMKRYARNKFDFWQNIVTIETGCRKRRR